MNLLPILLVVLAGVVITKGVMADTAKKKLDSRRSTPEQKIANLRSQMATAFSDGDTAKYVDLQNQIEILELETGL